VAVDDEILDAIMATEVAEHRAIRPPWVAFPGVHPFDIAWRMGAGETHLLLWWHWSQGRTRAEIVGTITNYGDVPADWACWAAEAAGLRVVDYESEETQFDAARSRLATVGISVDGALSE
jgi:hypothetical protein